MISRPRIVITAPWGERLGGAENMLWMFLKHLDRRRIEPLVVFLQPGPFEVAIAELGCPTVVVPSGRLRHIGQVVRTVLTLRRLLRHYEPNLLLNWSAKCQLYGASAAILAGRADRVIWWQHGLPKGHWIDRAASLLPARAVGCSSRAAARVQAAIPPSRPTFVVNPGIEPPPPLTTSDEAALRSQLEIPPGKPIVGTVGRLQPDRGQHRVLRVLAEVRRRGHDVHGLIVGGNAYNLSPGYEARLQVMVHDLGLNGAVTFTGQVPDAAPYVQLMRVLVIASIGEAFGIAVVDGLAAGVPVVAFDSAGPAEVVEPDVSGLLVPTGDEAALVAALERLLMDRGLCESLAEGGRQRFNARFSVEQMADQLVRALCAASRPDGKPLAAVS